MNELTFKAKLLIVLLVAAILCSLGSCVLRRTRTTLRTRRVDQLEQITEDAP
jgi:hypothetical protein